MHSYEHTYARACVSEPRGSAAPGFVAAKGCAPAAPNCVAHRTHGLHYLLISLLNISTARASRRDVIKINARRPRPGVTRLLFIIINNSGIARRAFILSAASCRISIVSKREGMGERTISRYKNLIRAARDVFLKNYFPSYKKLLKFFLFKLLYLIFL